MPCPMRNYQECVRHARAYANVTRNLRSLREQWMDEYGLTDQEVKRRLLESRQMPPHEFPPPQASAETCMRGKLRSYREGLEV